MKPSKLAKLLTVLIAEQQRSCQVKEQACQHDHRNKRKCFFSKLVMLKKDHIRLDNYVRCGIQGPLPLICFTARKEVNHGISFCRLLNNSNRLHPPNTQRPPNHSDRFRRPTHERVLFVFRTPKMDLSKRCRMAYGCWFYCLDAFISLQKGFGRTP